MKLCFNIFEIVISENSNIMSRHVSNFVWKINKLIIFYLKTWNSEDKSTLKIYQKSNPLIDYKDKKVPNIMCWIWRIIFLIRFLISIKRWSSAMTSTWNIMNVISTITFDFANKCSDTKGKRGLVTVLAHHDACTVHDGLIEIATAANMQAIHSWATKEMISDAGFLIVCCCSIMSYASTGTKLVCQCQMSCICEARNRSTKYIIYSWVQHRIQTSHSSCSSRNEFWSNTCLPRTLSLYTHRCRPSQRKLAISSSSWACTDLYHQPWSVPLMKKTMER